MKLERILQFLVAGLVVLGSTAISLGNQQLVVPLVVLLAAATAIVFTDTLQWFVIHRWIVNAAAVVAMLFFLNDFLRNDSTGQLASISYLLVCWQMVMLFQRKTPRVYWSLVVLSMLQLIVASVLHVGVQFGVLAVIYAVVSLFTMSALYAFREISQFQQRPEPRRRERAERAERVERRAETRPLLNHRQLDRELISWGMLRYGFSLIAVTLTFAAIFFYGSPRIRGSGWSNTNYGQRTETGFSRQVTLKQMGEILQSDDPVLRAFFVDHTTGRPYPLLNEPYFRGTVLADYSMIDGEATWQCISAGPPRYLRLPGLQVDDRAEIGRDYDLVRQDITMEPATEPTLFAVAPAARIDDSSAGFVVDLRTVEMTRLDFRGQRTANPTRFRLATKTFRRGVQASIIPHVGSSPFGRLQNTLTATEHARYTAISLDRFPELSQLARKILGDELESDNRLLQCTLLQNHFLGSADYTYSLDFTEVEKRRRRGVDPIEDFVANHRTGHCEYFASALIMMLRSQNIPARMVIGYRGAQFNQLANYYQVTQRHAHAWVEAYLEPQHLPTGLQVYRGKIDGGGWYRLDPTPGIGSSNSEVDPTKEMNRVDQLLDYARVLWNDYVVELDPERQEEAIYDPLENADTRQWLDRLTDWRRPAQLIRSWLARTRRMLGGSWFSWQAGLAFLLLSGLLTGLYYSVRKLSSWIRGEAGGASPGAPRVVPFYQKLESVLARLQLRRGPAQTQREFAENSAAWLAAQPELAAFAAIPAEIASAFYDVRFGRHMLSAAEQDTLLKRLHELDAAITARTQTQ